MKKAFKITRNIKQKFSDLAYSVKCDQFYDQQRKKDCRSITLLKQIRHGTHFEFINDTVCEMKSAY